MLNNERNAGAITVPDFKLYYRGIIVKNSTVLTKKKPNTIYGVKLKT